MTPRKHPENIPLLLLEFDRNPTKGQRLGALGGGDMDAGVIPEGKLKTEVVKVAERCMGDTVTEVVPLRVVYLNPFNFPPAGSGNP